MKGGIYKIKMKQILLLVILASALFAMPYVLAQDNSSLELNDTSGPTDILTNNSNITVDLSTNNSLNDDNETASSWKVGWKTVGLWFTFNQAKIAEKELELARLRLVQARIAAKNNNTVAMEKALDAHDKLIARLQTRMDKLYSLNESSDKLTGLDRAIEAHDMKVQRLNNLLLNTNLTEDQRAKIEARIAHSENITAKLKENEIRITQKVNKIEQKIEELKDKIENKTAEIENDSKNLQERAQERINKITTKINKNLTENETD